MKQKKSGFSIIEMLISMSLLLIIFSVIGAMLHSSRQTYQQTAAVAEEVEITDAAARLIRYDISMAGYIGLDNVDRNLEGEAYTEDENNNNPNAGEIIQVRYFEDRYTTDGEPELRHVSYYVGGNQEGEGLIRDDHNSDPQLLMLGVEMLIAEREGLGVNLFLHQAGNIQDVGITFNVPDNIPEAVNTN